MTDEKWFLFQKKVSSLGALVTSPAHAYGRGIGRMHIFFCEMIIIGRNLTILPVWLQSHVADDTVNKFCKSAIEVCEIT